MGKVVLSLDTANAGYEAMRVKVDAGTGNGVCNGFAVEVPCTADNVNNKFTAVGNNLANGDRIRIKGTPPSEIDTNVLGWVVGKSGDDFQYSLTEGGPPVDFTDDGTAVTFCVRLISIPFNKPAFEDPSGSNTSILDV